MNTTRAAREDIGCLWPVPREPSGFSFTFLNLGLYKTKRMSFSAIVPTIRPESMGCTRSWQ